MTTRTFGRYTVIRNLGRGGMAEVHLAHDPVLERPVAIKVIFPHLAGEVGFVTRFQREAKLIASLRHPNIVQLFDFAVFDDQPFMVMEYLAGETLKARLAALRAQGVTMALTEMLRLVEALAAALDYAHAQGAIHRDIKPANILFTAQGEPVLTDFGIAKLLDQTAQLSLTGALVGTPAYLSPEQAAGKPVDQRSDLYSLAVVTYELATGRVPFQADSPTALLMQHLLEPPPPPRTFNPNLPAAMEQVILQALTKEPDGRFASAGAFAQALRTALHGPAMINVSPEDVTVIESPSAAISPPTAPPRSLSAPPGRAGQPVERVTVAAGFVAREQELAQLAAWLERALAGQGQVCFVTGEAGAGKTALITEFAHRAQGTHTDLLIVAANCNTQSGVGDPYLPFRELLTRLIGLTGEATLPEATGPPAGIRSQPGRALAEHGPDLIDVFVPGDALRAKVADPAGPPSAWREQLIRLAEHKAQAAGQESGVEQRHIFEQYTNVLTALAAQQPLLLIVDDLQWVDTASADLLFHLSRRIGDSRILLVGTYRPDEVALGRRGEAHPLEKMLAELKRYFGDIQVTLHEDDEAARRRFVDSLLDREPNRLNEDFRRALFHHTGGHALFTVELLRTLQARGDLRQDETASWVAAPTLDWGQLPPRVEGVIEERIGRLATELREALTIASVEGEDFTAEVVARVQEVDARGLIRQLSRELAQQHRLVGAIGRQRVGQQHLSLFRFQHNLFQKYLYNNLNPVERAYFHEDVGMVLEDLYGDHADAIAVQLAWHFSEADLPEKARHYLASAGEQARRRYANAEAKEFYTRAIEASHRATPPLDEAQLLPVYEGRALVCRSLTQLTEAIADWRAMRRIAHATGDRHKEGESLCQLAYTYWLTFSQDEILLIKQYAQEAIACITTIEAPTVLARALTMLGAVDQVERDLTAAAHKLEEALQISRQTGDESALAQTLAFLCLQNYLQSNFPATVQIGQESAVVARIVHNDLNELRSQAFVCQAQWSLGNYDQALTLLHETMTQAEERGNRFIQGRLLNTLGWFHHEFGDFATAIVYDQQSAELGRSAGVDHVELSALVNLGYDYLASGEAARALEVFESTLDRVEREGVGSHKWQWQMKLLLGLAEHAYATGDYVQALRYAEAGLDEALAAQGQKYIAKARGLRGKILVQLEQHDTAGEELRCAVALAAALHSPSLLYPLAHAMGQWCETRGNEREAIAHYRQAKLAVEKMLTIGDEALRTAFLHFKPVQLIMESCAGTL